MATYKANWQETRERFTNWWQGGDTGRPLLYLWVRRATPLSTIEPPSFANDDERYLSVEKLTAQALAQFSRWEPIAEAFPALSLNLGAGSMALYLGSEPEFRAETVWFEATLKEYGEALRFDPSNRWFARHLDMYRQAAGLLADTDVVLEIPDIVENIDIVSALRGPQTLCYDLFDEPEAVHASIRQINEAYPPCYDAFADLCRDKTGGTAFTFFHIWGQGRTAKVQCDMAAILSPGQFRDFVQNPLREQCRWLDNSLYHLDGPECIVHVPALMEIAELKALQWTPGDGKPKSGEECWDDLYRAVRDAGKGMWISLEEYDPETAMAKADRLVRKFGANGFYFQMPPMEQHQADALLLLADRHWKTHG